MILTGKNNAQITFNVNYGDFSPYTSLDPGNYSATFYLTSNNSTLLNTSVQFSESAFQTVSLIGLSGANESSNFKLKAVVFDDIMLPPSTPALSSLRVFHISPNIGSLNVVALNRNLQFSVDYGVISSYSTNFTSGIYNFDVIQSESGLKIATFQLNVTGGSIYTIVIRGILNGTQPFSAVVTTEMSYQYAKVRFSHILYLANRLNVIASCSYFNVTLVTGLNYSASTDFMFVPLASNLSIKVESTNQTLISQPAQFQNFIQYDYTIFGRAGVDSVFSKTFESPYSAPASPFVGLVRFFHGVYDLNTIDIYIDNTLVVSNFGFSNVTQYLPLNLGVHLASIKKGSSNTTIAEFTFSIGSGNVQTNFIEGLASLRLDILSPTDAQFSYVNVRAANAAPSLDPIDLVLIADNFFSVNVITGVTFRQITPFQTLAYNVLLENTLNVRSSSSGDVYYSKSLDLVDGHQYTLTVAGNTTLFINFYRDDNVPPESTSSFSIVRFFDLISSNELDSVDVYFNYQEIFTGVPISNPSIYVPIVPGSYFVQVFIAGTNTLLFNTSTPLTFTSRTFYSFFIEGSYVYNGPTNDLTLNRVLDNSFFTLRVAHAVPDAPALTFFLEKNGISFGTFSNITFQGLSDYSNFVAGNYTLRVVNGLSKTILSIPLPPLMYEMYTVSLVGTLNGTVEIVVLTDQHHPPSSKMESLVKFFHASPDAGDLTITFGDDLVIPISYKSSTDYFSLCTQVYKILISNGNSSFVYEMDNYFLERGKVFSFYIEGLASSFSVDQTFVLIPFDDASFSYTSIRVSHAVPDSSSLSVFISDGIYFRPLITSLSYQQITNYTDIEFNSSATYTVFVYDDSGNLLNSQNIFPSVDNYFSLVINSLPSDYQTKVITDNFKAPDQSYAQIRLFNGIPNVASVTVTTLNHTVIFSNVTSGTVSSYQSIAAGTYHLVLYINQQVRNVVENLSFESGKIYTLFAEGLYNSNITFQNITLISVIDTKYDYAVFRVSHASSMSPAVDVILNDGITASVLFTNLFYKGTSAYTTIAFRYPYILQITLSSQPSSIILNANLNAVIPFPTTKLIVGPDYNDLEIFYLVDVSTAPGNSFLTTLQLVHAVVGGPYVDVYANDNLIFANVSYGSSVTPITITAATIRITIFSSGSVVNPIYDDVIALIGGQVNYFIAEGNFPNFELVRIPISSYFYFGISFAHAVVGAPSVDFYAGSLSNPVFTNVTFTQYTHFRDVLIGTQPSPQSIMILPAGKTSDPLFNSTLDLPNNNYFTFLLTGEVPNFGVNYTLVNAKSSGPYPGLGVGNVRVIHSSPDAPSISISLNDTVLFSNLKYLNISEFQNVPVGFATIHILVDNKIVLNSSFTFEEGIYTIFIEGLANSTISPLQVIVRVDSPPQPIFMSRLIHSAILPGVDLLYNHTLIQSNVSYAQASNYSFNFYGNTRVTLVPAGALSPVYFETTISIFDRSEYTLLLSGKSNSSDYPLKLTSIRDDLKLPTNGKAKIRFIHASPDAGNLTLFGNQSPLFKDLIYTQSSNYIEVDVQTYQLQVRQSNNTVKLISENELSFNAESPAVYSIVAEGFLNGNPPLTLVVYVDNSNISPPNPPSPNDSGSGLSDGAIVGIVVGVIVLIVLVILIVYFVRRRRKNQMYEVINATDS